MTEEQLLRARQVVGRPLLGGYDLPGLAALHKELTGQTLCTDCPGIIREAWLALRAEVNHANSISNFSPTTMKKSTRFAFTNPDTGYREPNGTEVHTNATLTDELAMTLLGRNKGLHELISMDGEPLTAKQADALIAEYKASQSEGEDGTDGSEGAETRKPAAPKAKGKKKKAARPAASTPATAEGDAGTDGAGSEGAE